MKQITALLAAGLLAMPAYADGETGSKAFSHAPIGVMGDHLHKKGEFMLSYRYMYMDMEGSRIGTNSVTPEQIVTTVPNQFFGTPGQPPTLRVVPTRMSMEMHMLGAMYAPSDNVTLMVMGMYGTRDMDHITFQGGMGTTELGEFTTRSSDFGDTKVAALIRLHDDETHKLHFNAGISIPTGSITEEDQILTPMGGTPTVRLPYPMQLGSGTWDLEPGITYNGFGHKWAWGAQARASIRLGDNSENYSLGDRYEGTAWLSYLFTDAVSASFRVKGATQGTIEGADPLIVAPVQTAQTDFQGGERIDLLGGLNFLVTDGFLKGHRLAVEAGFPVYQNLNGPQLETDFVLTVGWQKAF
jgi:hypothetical protein